MNKGQVAEKTREGRGYGEMGDADHSGGVHTTLDTEMVEACCCGVGGGGGGHPTLDVFLTPARGSDYAHHSEREHGRQIRPRAVDA